MHDRRPILVHFDELESFLEKGPLFFSFFFFFLKFLCRGIRVKANSYLMLGQSLPMQQIKNRKQ